MSSPRVSERKAHELRRQFDLSFALPPPREAPEVEDLLAIRLAGDPYAIRLRDIAGLIEGRRVIALPAVTPDLLGLSGIRGGIVPVFGLASILGHGQASASQPPPRWMILCGGEDAVALGLSDFEGYLRVPRSSLHPDDNLGGTRPFIKHIARTGSGDRGVIEIGLIVETIRSRVGHRRPAKEQ